MSQTSSPSIRPASPRLSAEQRSALPAFIEAFGKAAIAIQNTARNPNPAPIAIKRSINQGEDINKSAKQIFGDQGETAVAIGLDLNTTTAISLGMKDIHDVVQSGEESIAVIAETDQQKKLRREILDLVAKVEKESDFTPRKAVEAYSKTLLLSKRFGSEPDAWKMRCGIYQYDYLVRIRIYACRERTRAEFMDNRGQTLPKPISFSPEEIAKKLKLAQEGVADFAKNPTSVDRQKFNENHYNLFQAYYHLTQGKKPSDWDFPPQERFRNWHTAHSTPSRQAQTMLGHSLIMKDLLDTKVPVDADATPKDKNIKKSKKKIKQVLQNARPDPALARLDLHPGPYVARVHAHTMEDSIKTPHRPTLFRIKSAPGWLPDWKALPVSEPLSNGLLK